MSDGVSAAERKASAPERNASAVERNAAAKPPDAPFLHRELRSGGVLWLTMSRPERRNSLSRSAVSELKTALEEAAGDASVRALVLAATGPVFCAGHDLKELRSLQGMADGAGRAREVERLFAECSAMMLSIVRHPKAVIASVQGLATAAGCQLALSCDLVVAARSASFKTPGVDLGLFCSTPAVALGRAVPRKPAMEMLLLAEPLGAERARELGVINRVVDEAELEATVQSMAERVASRPARAVALGKQTFYRQVEASLEEAYRVTSEAMARNLLDPDADEGIGAFLEKRPADFREV